jgi:hypothetical protein
MNRAMAKPTKRIRVPAFPYAAALSGARLDALYTESREQRLDLVVDYHQLQSSAPPELSDLGGKLTERVRGRYLPRRLRFMGVQLPAPLQRALSTAPVNHRGRNLRGLLHWRLPGEDPGYWLLTGFDELGDVRFTAGRYAAEMRDGPGEAVDDVRDWSPAPPIPTRYMNEPRQTHHRYGGDPIAIHLNEHCHHRRLFVGGLDYQHEHRPAVGAVLNLGEEPSRWFNHSPSSSADRWAKKGEGRKGMSVAEIAAEARWVVERVRAGERVLVHCVAGFNRSVTVCCGALILLEHLSAEDALARVRQRHPWARPDSHHWLALRWLAHQNPQFSNRL